MHTPGPWKWQNDDGMRWSLRSTSGEVICDDGSAFGEYAAKINPAGPNARLIAAAPDLLEVLQLFLAPVSHEYDALEWHEHCCKQAKAAIAKATGHD